MALYQCLLCNASQPASAKIPGLCQHCHEDILQLTNDIACLACASPDVNGVCGSCLAQPLAFDRVIAPYVFEPPLSYLIKKFKYNRLWQLAPTLANFIPTPPPSHLLVPVPLHPKRLQERQFDHIHQLLKHVPHPTACVIQRQINNPPQASFTDKKSRYRNVKNCFQVTGALSGKNIAVFDDVITSGATMDEIARQLKRAGAAQVVAMSIARAPI